MIIDNFQSFLPLLTSSLSNSFISLEFIIIHLKNWLKIKFKIKMIDTIKLMINQKNSNWLLKNQI